MSNVNPPASNPQLMPVGVWIHIELPGMPGVIGFTYVDAQAGFSAQGWRWDGSKLDESARTIVRLPMAGAPWRRLDAEAVGKLGLETPPDWVAHYGPQPEAGTLWGAWREHPHLKGRFLPEHPDDLQVLVHDGGPRITRNTPELVWVRVNGMNGDVFRGRVLNQPHQLQSVREGSDIQFVVPTGSEQPIMATDKYLRERVAWTIHPCRKCGLSELFDAPSDLIRAVFPHTPPDAQMDMFTAFCPLCGGVQGVESRRSPMASEAPPATPPAKRPWWKFWG